MSVINNIYIEEVYSLLGIQMNRIKCIVMD